MARSRFRALFVLSTLLLIAPAVAAIGVDQVYAQSGTPIATSAIPPAPLAEAMPSDVAAYIATEFDPGSDQYLGLSALAAKLIIPGAGDTIAAIVEQLAKLLSAIPSDLQTVLAGEVGIGVSGFGSLADANFASQSPGNLIDALLPSYAIVLHPEEAGKARELFDEWFVGELKNSGMDVDRSQVGSIVVLREPGADVTDSAAPSVIVFSGDYILLGTDYESLMPYIEVTQGEAESLADSEALEQLNAALPTERLLFGYSDLGVLLESAGSLEVASIAISQIEAPIGQTAFTIAADDDGLRIESVSLPLLLSDSVPDTTGPNPDFAAAVPDTTLAMYAGQDLGESWLIGQLQKVLLTTLAGAMGAGDMDLSDFEIEDQFGFLAMITGINFKTDLLDQLEGDYGAALFNIDIEDPTSSSVVIASELANPDAVQVAVTSLGPLIQSAGSGTASVTTASVDGQTVNNVTLHTDGINGTVQYGVVDDQLMIGLGEGIETVAVPVGDSLDTSAGYLAAMAELPSTYDSVTYIDLESIANQVAPLLLELLAENSGNALVRCIAGASDALHATPEAMSVDDVSSGNSILDTGCSVLNSLLGGDTALLDLIISRMPGPLATVSYHRDGLQHTSGFLLVGSLPE